MAVFLNVIVPTYNASGTISELVEQLEKELGQYDFRILLIDDASEDNTRELILSLAGAYSNIDYYFAPKNQGQQASLRTGLGRMSVPCEYVVTMDDDLQNPVSVIPALIETIQSGYDLVYAVPVFGNEAGGRKLEEEYGESGTGRHAPGGDSHTPGPPSRFRRLGSRFRDLLFDSFTNKPPGIRVSAFRIMTGNLAEKLARSKKKFFYLSAEAFQYEIRAANISYKYVPRRCGRSSYHFGKLLLVYCKLLISYKLKVI